MNQNDYVVVSEAFLEEYKTKNGAWTKRQLELIGVNWPLAKNWKRKVIGKKVSTTAADEFKQLSFQSKLTKPSPVEMRLELLEKRIDDLENAFLDKHLNKGFI